MWQADRIATLKKSIYVHQSLYEYEGKETWWSPKVGELPETHKMFPGNVYRERLHLYEGVSKCAPSFFMHKAPTFTSRGFVIT